MIPKKPLQAKPAPPGATISSHPLPPPTPAVIYAHGCSCGAHALGSADSQVIADGIVHRCNLSCYRLGASKRVGVYAPAQLALDTRVAALERVVADLVLRLERRK